MDSNTLTIIGTLIVAIISGLLAYSSSLSTKEKEIKLNVYEKLGLDAHEIIEKLYSNTEWLLLTFQHRQNLQRKHLIAAGEQQPYDVDEIRRLRVRLKFFDKKCFQKYEHITKTHGELIPKIYGYIREPGEIAIPSTTPYTEQEVNSFITLLSALSTEIDETKEYVTNITSKKYNKIISSSTKISAIIYAVVLCAFMAFIFFPVSESNDKTTKEKVTLICS
ncbi:hypothetical protein I7V30_01645 [Lelliottia amnigena]|uniref:hypothetical protein n=1 Tax=Lelliottia amnigena TaxID=61646 RepID=UPI00192A91A2|nr:hypothetical protein [Lelliottia amnigena]MBL5963974.1 hypothetical protein [Lelliottia amnigena]